MKMGIIALMWVSKARLSRIVSNEQNISQAKGLKMSYWYLWMTCLLTLIGTGSANGETTAELQSFILAGMKTERHMVKTGIFDAKGRFSVSDPGQPEASGTLVVNGFFDAQAAKFRSDAIRPGRSIASGRAQWDAILRKVVVTPDLSLFYNEDFTRLEIHQPGIENIDSMPDTGGFIDIRGLGIDSFRQLFKNRTIDESFTSLEEMPATECVEEGKGVYRIAWITTPKDRRLTIWVDAENGFTPIRLQWQHAKVFGSVDEWLDPFETQEVGWRKVENVWVPTSYRAISHIPIPLRGRGDENPPPTRSFQYDLSINWKSVNNPLDDSLFQYEAMDLPVGTAIVDTRSGDRERLGVTGIDPGPPISLESRGRSPWLWILVAGNILFLFGIVAYFLRRKNR